MSQERFSLSIFSSAVLAEAVALGNPSDSFHSWSRLCPARLSSFFVEDWYSSNEDDPFPESGETSFVVDTDHQVFGNDAAVTICYERNTNVLECAENTALDGTHRGINSFIIELVLSRVETKPGLQSIFLVKIVSDHLSDNNWVFKTSTNQSTLVNEVEFMTRLPEIDFLLCPTHVVLDEAAHCTQMLNGLVWNNTALIAWPVKLAWVTDIAAAVAWLHAQAIFWGDLKTDNIILCKDGHYGHNKCTSKN
ncbi:hypothetical protein C8R44DRAFT_751438 [Mycena epipterygia]|nr:hypothetical protein C8R44DRAFT_751438 [Mycena epipterygia]